MALLVPNDSLQRFFTPQNNFFQWKRDIIHPGWVLPCNVVFSSDWALLLSTQLLALNFSIGSMVGKSRKCFLPDRDFSGGRGAPVVCRSAHKQKVKGLKPFGFFREPAVLKYLRWLRKRKWSKNITWAFLPGQVYSELKPLDLPNLLCRFKLQYTCFSLN